MVAYWRLRDTMVAYWRQAGLSYIRYSQICAKAVRDALKTEFRASAEKTSGSSVKIVKINLSPNSNQPKCIETDLRSGYLTLQDLDLPTTLPSTTLRSLGKFQGHKERNFQEEE
ncbi:ATP synthase subunit epsilon, mitochondrial [Galemys pyrenaicus]|uniref:ATP synthase subunit epsilon, mitochondrial n=1 Tax=Galemys pyrenaicus TaxID=202257 RepID=A0A8J6A203_GALPY|nr:ATP synthase subunit epsilon, mitochondrial [Galemys pyrenaicus]